MTAGSEPFLMCVEDVFDRNQGRMVLLTGRIERGRVREGDMVETVGLDGGTLLPVRGVEVHHRRIDEAGADTHVGLLLPGVASSSIERGQVLAAPGSVAAHARFTADIALLAEDHGGAEIRSGERLQFHVRTAVVRGTVMLAPDTDVLPPLHRGTVMAALERPVALEEGQPFAFRQHGRAAGTGTVTRLPN
ncbi:EF-Tu C-terminal domain-related protein [Streptomyces sp. NPDC001675]